MTRSSVPVLQPGANGLRSGAVERHHPLLAPLAEHAHHASAQVHVVDVESGEFTQPESRRIEQLENGVVTAAERLLVVWRLEHPRHLLLGQVCRHPHFALRRGDERASVRVDDAFATQVPEEGADGGELAGGGRPRLPFVVKVREERADGVAVERIRLEVALLQVGFGGDVTDELREIAVVGPHRVRRHVPVEGEEPEEGLQVLDHSALSRIQSASTSSARFAIAIFRSILLRGGFASGSMMPKVMFDGS